MVNADLRFVALHQPQTIALSLLRAGMITEETWKTIRNGSITRSDEQR
jgi:hypothetical protein